MADGVFVVAAVANVLAFLVVVADKWRARRRRRRTPERVLLVWIFLGPAGAWAGLVLVRHKVSKRGFVWPAAVIAGCGTAVWVVVWWALAS